MLQLRILSRRTNLIRYGLFDEEGRQVKDVERDCESEIAEAQKSHTSLADILARAEGTTADGTHVAKDGEPSAVLLEHSSLGDHTHEEFDWPAKDHTHDHEHPPHEHEHPVPSHEHEHGHPFDEHEHEMPAHGHAAIGSRLTRIEAIAETLEDHEHEHEHTELEAGLEAKLVDLAKVVQALAEAVRDHRHTDAHEHPLPAHEHSLPAHAHEYPHHAHDLAEHSHPKADHAHEVPAHDHPAKEHAHPEITGRWSSLPAEVQAKAETIGVHLHRFDTNNGSGWVCGICGQARSEISS